MHAIEGTISRFSDGTNKGLEPPMSHLGSNSAVAACPLQVRSTPSFGHWSAPPARQLSADFVAKVVDGFREQ